MSEILVQSLYPTTRVNESISRHPKILIYIPGGFKFLSLVKRYCTIFILIYIKYWLYRFFGLGKMHVASLHPIQHVNEPIRGNRKVRNCIPGGYKCYLWLKDILHFLF